MRVLDGQRLHGHENRQAVSPTAPGPTQEAIDANQAGVELADARRYADALPHYEQAIRPAPDWYAVNLNIGIACKHTANWERSLPRGVRRLEALGEGRASSMGGRACAAWTFPATR
jgi:hypothetical protein